MMQELNCDISYVRTVASKRKDSTIVHFILYLHTETTTALRNYYQKLINK